MGEEKGEDMSEGQGQRSWVRTRVRTWKRSSSKSWVRLAKGMGDGTDEDKDMESVMSLSEYSSVCG